MFCTSDLNSLLEPPPGSVETSTANLLPAWAGAVSTAGPRMGAVGVAEGFGDGVGVGLGVGVGVGSGAITSGRFCSSRVLRWSNPPVGPRTTVVSLTKPTPGKNHLSSLADMTEESSQ